MPDPSTFNDTFTARAWGPDALCKDVTVIFHYRVISPFLPPGVAGPRGADDSAAEAKVCPGGGGPTVTWRRRPAMTEFTLGEFEEAAIRESGLGAR
jgi:hypothetical protein